MFKHPRKRYRILSLLLLGFFVGHGQADIVLFDSMLLTHGDFQAQIQPYIVTSESPVNGPGNQNIATPGTSVLGGVNGVPAAGINHDGIGQLSITIPTPTSSSTVLCTGSLLTSGQHILTAAHCLTATNTGTINASAGQIQFDLPGGVVSFPFGPADISIHPSYNGVVTDGFDVAVIDLNTILPASVPRYDIVSPAPFTAPVLGSRFGFGEGGHGNTGFSVPPTPPLPSTKRFGQNVYEADGLEAIGVTNPDTQLTIDFDNGLAANDAFGFFGSMLGEGGADTGLGAGIEANSAPGDSGGPTFVDEGGVLRIGGISSYGISLSSNGNTTDIAPGGPPNGSFGEFSVDARIGNQSINDFIIEASAVPEPTSFLMLSCLLYTSDAADE